jgi:CHAD domain-containing protein
MSDLHTTLKKSGHTVSARAVLLKPNYRLPAVHDFRTAVKKLRAFLRWQSMDRKTTGKDFRNIYHAAGDIRNLQVLLKHIREKKISLPQFSRWLRSELKKAKKKWEKTYDKKIMTGLEKKLAKIKTVRYRQWFLVKKTELRSILKSPTDASLHEARKIYKDLQYINEWSKKNKTHLPPGSPRELAKAGKQLGRYHDRVIALDCLATYLALETDTVATQKALLLQKKWILQKASHKRTLLEFLSRSLVA